MHYRGIIGLTVLESKHNIGTRILSHSKIYVLVRMRGIKAPELVPIFDYVLYFILQIKHGYRPIFYFLNNSLHMIKTVVTFTVGTRFVFNKSRTLQTNP